MRLWHNSASPFARKVRIVARETGSAARMEEIAVAVSPVNANADVAAQNPLVKIPALQTDEGAVLYDSAVICEYLDSLHAGTQLFSSGKARWNVLRLQALCDGILDAAVLCRYENAIRPKEYRWDSWMQGQFVKIRNGLDTLEREVFSWNDDFGIGQIGAVCVAGYLDFRFANEAWRTTRPKLSSWYEQVSKRPSVAATAPA